MNEPEPTRRAQRRAYVNELRKVARLLRFSGAALALLGAAGLILMRPGAWWAGPAWFSLIAGSLLILAGAVRRVREHRRRTDTP